MASVRVRSTIAGTVVILVGSIIGSVLLVLLLQRALASTANETADGRAEDVARLITDSDEPGKSVDLEDNAGEDQVIQVLDGSRRVVAASSQQAAGRPLTTLAPRKGQTLRADKARVPALGSETPFVLTALGVNVDGQLCTVVVATSVSSQSESVAALVRYLVVLVPMGSVLVGIGMWVLVGRSLRPVERIRRHVATIGSQGLGERVPVPESDDEIARLALTMNEMLKRLDSAHQLQRAFVSDASHELRSPLTSLSTSLDVVGVAPSESRWTETRAVMTAEVARMARLVDDLLLLAKADDRGMVLHVEDVDLDDIVEDEVRRMRSHGRLRVTATIAPVRVRGDRGRLSRAVRNVVENAAAAASGSVHVGLASIDGSARIVVEDDGPGVPVAHRERVFERFVRLDDSRSRDSGGSGLGLAIVREIVAAHGGAVTMDESPTGGARVTVTVQLVQPPAGSSR
ncbi:HAMP domain-containing histidine kinase [Aeromicrobium sp. YC3-14]|nr:HAMP domain-containing sensor histidine kinase [Aeromicrobium stalagmiti]NRQ51080.1 HAMP domain-containing histidine kinase [Aeromicrobium stalagmiti]